MQQKLRRKGFLSWAAPLLLVASAYACGSSDSPGAGVVPGGGTCTENAQCSSGTCQAGACTTPGGMPGGATCTQGSECASGTCASGTCTAVTGSGSTGGASGTGGTAGTGKPNGSDCTSASECAGGLCVSGTCSSTGSGKPNGSDCTSASECAGGLCVSGKCSGTGTGIPGSGTTTTGPHFPGSGQSFRPLTAGCGPETADQCTGTCEKSGGSADTTVIRPPATLCFAGQGDLTPDDPSVVIEQVIEKVNGKEYVHIRVTFDPAFTDNTYGEGSCCGWPNKRGHRFSDLTGSDHTELLLTDADGTTVMNFKVDLVTADANSPCGFGTLGVSGGDGSMIQGDAAHVLAVATSLDRNLNGCGYCEIPACGSSGDCTQSSPSTDASYTPNAGAPNWDFRQVYEVWIDMAAFTDKGFGQAYITYTHSSPGKGEDTITVDPTPCPPEWDTPYCPPSVIAEGGNCFGTPGSGGSSGVGGATGTGGSSTGTGGSSTGTGGSSTGTGGSTSTTCPPNYQTYVTSEGASICTPIPFANYPNRAACPTGYVLDVASEGQYCLPTT